MLMKQYDLVVLGETLIDFTPAGTSEGKNPIFERNPGGSTANLSCAAAKNGIFPIFISQVGDDLFGRALKEVMTNAGVDTQYMYLSKEYRTTLAFVQLADNGERQFSFYRKYGADTMLTMNQLPREIIQNCQYFATGSVIMAEGESRESAFEGLRLAKEGNGTIFFDPNLRYNLWEDVEELRQVNLQAFQYADILKISDEELPFLMEEDDIEAGIKKLFNNYPVKLLLFTRGKDGCRVITREYSFEDIGFPIDITLDTTGAGDSFSGSFLSQIIQKKKSFDMLTREDIQESVRYANATAALVTTKRGGISSLPTPQEVEEVLRQGFVSISR